MVSKIKANLSLTAWKCFWLSVLDKKLLAGSQDWHLNTGRCPLLRARLHSSGSPPFTHFNRRQCDCPMALAVAFWRAAGLEEDRADSGEAGGGFTKWKADIVKHCLNKDTEGRQRITKTSYSAFHTHTHPSACQPPTFTFEEEGHSGPVEG